MNDAINALAPCPFCGAKPHKGLGKKYYDQLHGELHQDYSVWCPKRHAVVTRVNEEQATEEWNTRALRPEPSAADALSPATEVRREAIARIVRRAMLDYHSDGDFIERDKSRQELSDEAADAILALPCEAEIRADPISDQELAAWARNWHWNDYTDDRPVDPSIYFRDMRMLKAFIAQAIRNGGKQP